MIALLTSTGKRPLMMPLCVRWVMAQTRLPDLWIISLGEHEELGDVELPWFARVHRWTADTLGQGMTGEIDSITKYHIEVMRQVPKGYDAIYFDDDDWYGRTYIETIAMEWRQGFTFSGNGSERRYCLQRHQWMEIEKPGCNTGAMGMRSCAIEKWMEWAQDPTTKWDWLSKQFKTNLRNGAPRVSIKNGPGVGHIAPPAERKWRYQSEKWGKLREWIGDDVAHYQRLMCE